MKRSRVAMAALTMTLLVSTAACGDDDETSAEASATTAAPNTSGADGSATGSLAGICPDTVAIQTSWFPEVEYGGMYNLVGPDGDFDATTGRYSGPLGDTGINVEVRAGGPLSGNEQVTAQLYTDDSLFMGMLATDEQIQNSKEQPTLAVMSYFDKDPQILFFDPGTYDFTSIADIGKSDATVLYFEGSTYMEYLVGSGQIREEQVDGSYTGGPDRWVAADGKAVQSGLISSEPYRYEFETDLWNKPVEPLLVFDSGYVNYASSLAMRPELVEEYDECLQELVPIMQQSTVDFFENPVPVSDRITKMNEEIAEFWQTSSELNAYSIDVILERELVVNDSTGTLGNFDPARVQEMIDILTPIFAEQNVPLADGLAAEDIFTDKYVEEGIGL